jgi:hypothetical protein
MVKEVTEGTEEGYIGANFYLFAQGLTVSGSNASNPGYAAIKTPIHGDFQVVVIEVAAFKDNATNLVFPIAFGSAPTLVANSTGLNSATVQGATTATLTNLGNNLASPISGMLVFIGSTQS